MIHKATDAFSRSMQSADDGEVVMSSEARSFRQGDAPSATKSAAGMEMMMSEISSLKEALEASELKQDRVKYWSEAREATIEDLMTEKASMQEEICFMRDEMGEDQPLYIKDEVASFNRIMASQDSQAVNATKEKLTPTYVALIGFAWLSKQRRSKRKKLREEVFQLRYELQEQDKKMRSQPSTKKLREEVFQLRSALQDQEDKTKNRNNAVTTLEKRLKESTAGQQAAQEKPRSREARLEEKMQLLQALDKKNSANEQAIKQQRAHIFGQRGEIKTEQDSKA